MRSLASPRGCSPAQGQIFLQHTTCNSTTHRATGQSQGHLPIKSKEWRARNGCARNGRCKKWTVQGMDGARNGRCKEWNDKYLERGMDGAHMEQGSGERLRPMTYNIPKGVSDCCTIFRDAALEKCQSLAQTPDPDSCATKLAGQFIGKNNASSTSQSFWTSHLAASLSIIFTSDLRSRFFCLSSSAR